MTLRLAVIGDLHYSVDLSDASLSSLRDTYFSQLLRTFFAHDADLHIALGDVTHRGQVQEWAFIHRMTSELAEQYGRRFRFVLGNHDSLTEPKTAVLGQTGQFRYVFEDHSECRLVFLDTTGDPTPTNWGGMVDEAQLCWLSGLGPADGRPLLVFGHHPIAHTTWASDMPMMFLANGDQVASRLEGMATQIIYFNGHNHVHSIAQQRRDHADWTYVQLAASVQSTTYQSVSINEQDVSIETYQCSPSILNLAESYCSAIPGFMKVENPLGGERDRQVQVSLDGGATVPVSFVSPQETAP
ncbi:MAG: metallophosphoesterase [Alicyclobacillus herbarius]|uniref:metallophosphoesterase family protein n=1 Tax=Alicyclobacillus herbarius TaxID=122960 RepID=UPI002355F85B|nr:metallophosphoesterase [Alicyclobacillus herbarius]MCL6632295.1 metallophosphoesterase [Alicyclobacillus herbarius]